MSNYVVQPNNKLQLTSASLEQRGGISAGHLDDGEDVNRGFEFGLLENQDFAGLGADKNMPIKEICRQYKNRAAEIAL